MKKKVLLILAIIVCCSLTLGILAGCNDDDTDGVKSILIDSNGSVELSNGELILPDLVVTADDGTTSRVPITADMISAADLEKLNTFGQHDITVNYQGKSTGFRVTIVGEKGDKGDTGNAGLGIKNISLDKDGNLSIEYTDNSKTNLGKIKGADGEDGTDGSQGDKGETGDKGDQGIKGDDGTDGRGIANITLNEKGELVITYTDATTTNLGKIVGKDGTDGKDGVDGSQGDKGDQGIKGDDGADGINGADGRGIKSINLNEKGQLVVTYSDGSTEIIKANTTNGVDINWYNQYDRIFTISTADELNGLSYLVNSGRETFKGKIIKLTADIDLAGIAYKPIGERIISSFEDKDGNIYNTDYPIVINAFEGTFDACNHAVKNLVLENKEETMDNFNNGCALFGHVAGAKIMNLTVDGFNLAGDRRLAAVASFVYGGDTLFKNITVRNTTLTNTYEDWGMGAIFGQMFNYSIYNVGKENSLVTLDNCVVENSVTLNAQGVGWNVGGLWGSITEAKNGKGPSLSGLNATLLVKNCTSSANIIALEDRTVGKLGGWALCENIVLTDNVFEGTLKTPDGEDFTDKKSDVGSITASQPVAYVSFPNLSERIYYTSIEEALNACNKGQTVTLLKDHTIDSLTVAGINAVLDLNGYTLTIKYPEAVPAGQNIVALSLGDGTTKTTLGIKNGTVQTPVGVKGTAYSRLVYVDKSATLNLYDGAVLLSNATTPQSATLYSYGTVNMEKGSKIIGNYGVGVFKTAKFNMTGGEINAVGIGICSNGGKEFEGYTINISGGKIISDNTVLYLPSAGTTTIKGTAENPVYMEATYVYDGTNEDTYWGVPVGIVIRAGNLTIGDNVTVKVNCAENPKADIVNGWSGSFAAAIVIGRPKTADGAGYVGDINVSITGKNINIVNLNETGKAIIKVYSSNPYDYNEILKIGTDINVNKDNYESGAIVEL